MRKPMAFAIVACGQGTAGGDVIVVLPGENVARNTIPCFMMTVAVVVLIPAIVVAAATAAAAVLVQSRAKLSSR